MNLAAVRRWSETITALHSGWDLHGGQKPVVRAVFADQFKSIFIRCGRKWGKTETALYLLWRIAQSMPGSPCYYFAPAQVQAREILWTDPRVKVFGPREWLLEGSRGINESQMLLRFKNGSFIKLDGTDNYNKYRGVKYRLSVYDEYKDSDPRMRRAMRPNASVLGGIDVFMGSPPEIGGTDYEALETEHKADPAKFSIHAPTWANPHISRAWLKQEKATLYGRGEGDEWEREYGADYVKGGKLAIFPMLKKTMVKPHAEVLQLLRRDRKKLQWFWWNDPAGSSCFATLFVAINPYSKVIYVLDEIYEQRQEFMTVASVGQRAHKKRDELHDEVEAWRAGYDEAASWFRNEYIDQFPEEGALEPSQKAHNDKKFGISLIKEALKQQKLVFSERAAKLYWEMDQYKKGPKGEPVKKNDHLIDDLRYILGAAQYELKPVPDEDPELDEDFRGESLEQAFYGDKQDPYRVR